MRNAAFKYCSLIIGLLAAVAIIFSHSYPSTNDRDCVKSVVEDSEKSTEQKGESDVAEFTISATSFPSPAQVALFQQATCLFEVVFAVQTSEATPIVFDLPVNKFCSTILGVIISPNAP